MKKNELIKLLSATSGYKDKHPSMAAEILVTLAAHGLTVVEASKVPPADRLIEANTDEKAIEIPLDDCGLSVTVGRDGTWLHFTATSGTACSFNMEIQAEREGKLFGKTIADWCEDRRKQAKEIAADNGQFGVGS